MLEEMKRLLVRTGCNHMERLGEIREKFPQCAMITAMEGRKILPDDDLRNMLKEFETGDLR
jgi:hypothetical protein